MNQRAHIEAAKHLRLTVTRYIAKRATLDDIRDAMATLVAAAPVAGEPGYRVVKYRCPNDIWDRRTPYRK